MSAPRSDALIFFGATGDQYEPRTWGPKEVERLTPPGGWHDPVGSG